MKRIKPSDFKGNYKLKIKIKQSEPACMMCLPPAPVKGHKSLNGVLFHSRIDCPPDTLYMMNDSSLDNYAEKLSHDMTYKIENHIKLSLQPKPTWLPDFIYKRIIKRLLVLNKLV